MSGTIESNYQGVSNVIIRPKPDFGPDKDTVIAKPKSLFEDIEIEIDNEFDREYDDLRILQVILRLFIAQAKTLQKKMEAEGNHIRKLNELQQEWTSKQTNIRQFSPDDFLVLFPKADDASKRLDMASKMNEASDRFRDLIRSNRDQVKDDAQRCQSALQTTIDERMKMFDNFTKVLGDMALLYSMLFKG